MLAGGNAVDAAIASAAALTVVEPTANGIGSDAFAVVWNGKALHGLNASGRSPTAWTRDRFSNLSQMPARGWDSVTVPGAVSAWVALSDRFGKLPFSKLFEPAIEYAMSGFPLSPVIAKLWARIAGKYRAQPGFEETFMPGGNSPKPGELFHNQALGRSLQSIAETRGAALYEGKLGEALVAHSSAHGGALSIADLAEHRVDWCGTVEQDVAGLAVHEIPPNGQGIAALMALGILKRVGLAEHHVDSADAIHLQIEATKLALVDVEAFVGDPATMRFSPRALLDDNYLDARAQLIDRTRAGDPVAGAPKEGGTVYLATADASGMMVSFIQSNYEGFGAGVVVPGTGISMQNRGMGFSLQRGHPNEVGPRKRPFHTIIPGFAMRSGQPAISFGLMGGPMQAQGHVQLVLRMHLFDQNPQAASDAPRWQWIGGRRISLEAGTSPAVADALAARGHQIQLESPAAAFAFGGAQIIVRTDAGYVAGSDHRKDGAAAGF